MASSSQLSGRNFSINYLGSKYKLYNEFIKKIIAEVSDPSDKKFIDLFAGTGIVGFLTARAFDMEVTYNDIQEYSYILTQACSISYTEEEYKYIQKEIEKLNNLEGINGFIWKHYSPAGKRMFFTEENARKIDAIRLAIDKVENNRIRPYLLASLLSAADKVANVSCIYEAFLKKFKNSALKAVNLTFIKFSPCIEGYSIKGKAEDITGEYDIAYLDPPYNIRQYCSLYHILETIAKYDHPDIKGVAGKRNTDDQKSELCKRKMAAEALDKIVSRLKVKKILLSYNDEGIIPKKEIVKILEKYGYVDTFVHDYKKFKAKQDVTRKNTVEIIFYLRKYSDIIIDEE